MLAVGTLVVALAVLPATAGPLPVALGVVGDGPAVGEQRQAEASHRLIVELQSAPLAVWSAKSGAAMTANGRLDADASAAQNYVAQLQAEQQAFINRMQVALPGATVSRYIDEHGAQVQQTFEVLLNAIVVDPGAVGPKKAMEILAGLPGVAAVYRDYGRMPHLYSSTALINAPVVWQMAGGRADAGAGVKVASVDTGVHHRAPMFDGTGWDYPADYPQGGLGLKANNNGKIIASRAYFRTWDPPAPTDINPWPGPSGSSHGTHTASIAVGNVVEADYVGRDVGIISGVAPGAWVMSYKIFYDSVSGEGGAWDAEIIAALEDAVRDGADVINNSWGGGPTSVGGDLDALDSTLINAVRSGVFVSMSIGNAGPGLGTGDHPSPDYINVAASTTSARLSWGRLHVTAPDPVPPSSAFVGHNAGANTLDWYDQQGDASALQVDTVPSRSGNQAEVIPGFSSRGPAVGHGLKPDIAAPGGNILAQGYDPTASGEASHLGFGQVSGTSMAAPHIAGSAALLRQLHPDWSVADIKSALMSTAKYMDIYTHDGRPAQPLDMGAGRVDLTNAADPGVLLDPPYASFGLVDEGDTASVSVRVENITATSETYAISMLDTRLGFTQTTVLAGVTVSPTNLTLGPGEWAWVNVEFDSTGRVGDNQGYVVLDGDTHAAHFPVWARGVPVDEAEDPEILVIDNDGSVSLGLPDYGDYYTRTLESLGYAYDVLDVDALVGAATTFVPELHALLQYEAIIYLTGDNFYADDSFPVPTPPTQIDLDRLTEYANSGGLVIAMGQDLSSVFGATDPDNAPFFFAFVFGAEYIQDSVTATGLPQVPVVGLADAPVAFDEMVVDLLPAETTTVDLTGGNVNPPHTSPASGTASFTYRAPLRELSYDVTVDVTEPMTITNAHIHSGTVGVNGGVLYPTFPFTESIYVTDTLSWDGVVIIAEEYEDQLLAGDTYFNIHSTAHSAGELRAQVRVEASGDGADNQNYIDEIRADPLDATNPDDPEHLQARVRELMRYPGDNNDEGGVVAIAHRDQPSIERTGVTYRGRSIYTTFGLEGVNNGDPATASREELLQAFLNWGWDEPTVTISDTTVPNASNLTTFAAGMSSNLEGVEGMTYRWDFGDGTPIKGPYASSVAAHQYERCGHHTVTAEGTDTYGNRAVGTLELNVTENCKYNAIYLSMIFR